MLYTSEKLSNAYYLKENFYEVMAPTDYNTAKARLTRWMIMLKIVDYHALFQLHEL